MNVYPSELDRETRIQYKKYPRTLGTELQKYVGKYIKVGSGGAYFFCDKAGEDILDVISKASEDYYKSLLTSDCRLVNQIANHSATWDNRRVRRRNELKKSGYSDSYIDIEVNKMFGYEKDDLRMKISTKRNLEKRISEYTSFLDRRVVTVFPCNDFLNNEETFPSTIILFEGVEKGPYWSYDEYHKGVDKEDLEEDEESWYGRSCRSSNGKECFMLWHG